MPYRSEAQRRWGNSPAGKKALGEAGVAEWNAASEGAKLPERAAKTPAKMHRADSRRDLVKMWKGKR